MAGTDQNFRLDEFADTMRSRIVSVFSEALAAAACRRWTWRSATRNWAMRCCRSSTRRSTAKYGMEITSFMVENVSVPPEVEQAIDKRSSMGAIGNLNDYVKFQMAQGHGQGRRRARPPRGAAQMAMGFGMAQEMMQAAGRRTGRRQLPARSRRSATAARRLPEVLTPGQAAQLLGVPRRRDGLHRRRRPEGQKIGAPGASPRARARRVFADYADVRSDPLMNRRSQSRRRANIPAPSAAATRSGIAAKKALVCPYCGTVVPWADGEDPLGAAIVEHDLQRRCASITPDHARAGRRENIR